MGCQLEVEQEPDSILFWEFIWGLPYTIRTWGIEVWSHRLSAPISKVHNWA